MNPFAQPGEWLRCQLHCHTTESDGTPTPAELVAHYAAAGCDVLAITDHWLITTFDTEAPLLLPASELSARLAVPPFEVDVLAYGIQSLPEPREEFPSIEACTQWIVDNGGVAFLAHPYWSTLHREDYVMGVGLSGLEVWNGGCEVLQGSGLSDTFWDDLLQSGLRPFAIATDDAHDAGSAEGSDSRLGWTMVRVQERTCAAVIEALRTGAFYATTGPELLDISIEDGRTTVRTSPAHSITLRSGAWDGGRVNANSELPTYRGEVLERSADGGIVAARFEAPEFWNWGRIEMIGMQGGRAWSNPYDYPEPTGTFS